MAANRLVVGCGPTRVVSQHMGAPANRRTLDTTADQPGGFSVNLAELQRKLESGFGAHWFHSTFERSASSRAGGAGSRIAAAGWDQSKVHRAVAVLTDIEWV